MLSIKFFNACASGSENAVLPEKTSLHSSLLPPMAKEEIRHFEYLLKYIIFSFKNVMKFIEIKCGIRSHTSKYRKYNGFWRPSLAV